MATIAKRSLILSVSRLLGFVVMFFSPMFLVRILDKEVYGQYREFIVYSMMAISFVSFSINSNIIYFIPKGKDISSVVFNTLVAIFTFSIIGVACIYLCRNIIIANTSFDFIGYMILYMFVFVNGEVLEPIFLVKHRSDLVLIYSIVFALIRIFVLILVAYLTRDIESILISLIVVEVIRKIYTLYYLRYKIKIIAKLDISLLKKQLVFIVPLGISSVILYLNSNISKLVISSIYGASLLAIYSVGSQQIPIMNILRSSINDVIFPEMVSADKKNALNLWKSANVIYVAISLPIFLIFFINAELFIKVLFTAEYLDAVPLFRIYLFLMLRQCFEMGTPLRSRNKNTYFIWGNVLSLVVNITLIYFLSKISGILGPAFAFIVTDCLLALYLMYFVLKVYNLKLRDLLLWNDLRKIAIVNFLSFPVILSCMFFPFLILYVGFVSVVFLIINLILLNRSNVSGVTVLVSKFFNIISKWISRRKFC